MGELYRNSYLNNNEVIYFFTDKRFIVLDIQELNILSQTRYFDFQPEMIDCEFVAKAYQYKGGFLVACNVDSKNDINCPNQIQGEDVSQRNDVWVCRVDV